MTPRVLVTETLAPSGLELLRKACDVTVRLNPSPDELLQIIGDYQGLIVRSSTQVTEAVLAAGSQLAVVGRAGTGVDNIDLEAATRHGIIVVNAPTGNTVAVAEHTLALMLALARHVCEANVGMHAGRWDKKHLMGSELRGKTLGLVGLGRVGAAVAARARAFEMRVIAYDPFVSRERAQQLDVQLVGLEQLLAQVDYVSLHAPLTERTRGMIGARELTLIKPGAYLVNCARGELLDEEALAQALQVGTIAGAALDVFAHEPDIYPVLRSCPNCLLTPHLGASTEEAQTGAAEEVVQQVVDVLEGRPARYPVNVAALPPEEAALLAPYLELTRCMGRFYAQFAENHLTRLEVTFAGEVAAHDLALLTAAALAGVLSEMDEPVNLVNAPLIARERGIVVDEVRTSETFDFTDL
ncbi:MAG: phosphoglycerate dehydrogenase, partial [Chloroflexi bacterium]|nr:phosphoglycerate dehydrogenase [Chloroflexota bacterium]